MEYWSACGVIAGTTGRILGAHIARGIQSYGIELFIVNVPLKFWFINVILIQNNINKLEYAKHRLFWDNIILTILCVKTKSDRI